MSEVRAGDVIAGKFQVERVLGEGGMGYVVAARHLQLGQTVALKFMREEVCTAEYKSRFLREARNTVRLKSKHVSRVLDVGALDGGTPYMVMEYLEGTDLSALLQQRGQFPVAEACEYVIQACEAIAEAHGHGIVHRDLKPANLFLTRGTGGEPVVKVLDFGVSKLVDIEADTKAGGRHDSVVTKVSDLLGSPTYMAPEQVVSARDADAKSDVWSLGVILYRLIGGKAPFTGSSLGDLIQNIMYGPIPNLRELRPDLPAGFEQLIWRCLARPREQRPDVIELARQLSPFAGPNATPSIERIAILGPALVTSPSGTTGGRNTWTKPPATGHALHDTRREGTTSVLVWGVVGAACLGSLAILGARFFATKRDAQSAPAVTFVPVPMPPPVSAEPPPPASTPSALPVVPPSVRPTVHPPVVHPKPRPTQATPASNSTKPSAPSDDIPASRE
jgi:serine/threonine-protein kinase